MTYRSLTQISGWLFIASLAFVTTGCAAAGIMSMAPEVVEVAGMAAGSGVSKMQGKPDEFGPEGADEQRERCEQLTRDTPGVEEVRQTKDGSIESRQWRILHAVTPEWMISPTRTAPQDGWEAKPEISRLNFNPPLSDSLKPGGQSMFVAYAPSDVKTPADSEVFETMTSAFGAAQGSFEWRQRNYDYVMVPKLPCFKISK